MAPTITDAAKKAGVSVGTVSRVMNGEANVSPELRRKVLIEARRIGFVPKLAHSRLAILTGRHHPTLPTGYTTIMSSLVEQHASRRRIGVEIVDLDNIDLLYDCRIEAAIGIVFDDRIEELLEIPNLPVFTINHPMSHKGIHSIYTDHYEQGLEATRHLLARGHTRIAFLADLPDEWGARERLRGYDQALAEVGLSRTESSVRFSSAEPLYDILRRWIREEVTAILNLGEDVGAETIHLLQNVLNLRIGTQISTVTLEDLPFYQYMTPPQTVIRQPLEELASLAVERALEMAAAYRRGECPKKALDLRLHGQLVERESVAQLKTAGSRIRKARIT